MSEAPNPGQELATQTAPARAVREYRVVENALGIMDTARFEHLGRVASVMARAGLMPMSLTHSKPPGAGDNVQPQELPYEVIQARAFLIVNQADLFQMDPNALAQCVSIVHGKLMYEGKLVHALVSAKLGLDLVYEFGTYDPVKRDIQGEYLDDDDGQYWEGKMPTTVDDQALAVRVSGILPGEHRRRWIAGSVGMWHKGAKSPWGSPQAWPRQLRYMGAREWVRAHKPSLLLGIMTDDEVDEYDMGRQAGAIAAPAPQMLHSGFADARPAELLPPEPQTEAPAAKRTRGKGKAAQPAPLPPHNPETGEVIEAQGNAPATDGAPAAGSAPATLETVTDASTAGAAGTTPSEAQDGGTPEEVDVISAGVPAPGEVYHLDGDSWLGDGKRDTYKDGKPFSSAGRSAGYAIYDDHAPEPEQAPAEAAPAAEAEEDPLHPELSAYIDQVDAAREFPAVKIALKAFMGTQFWKDISNGQANRIRANTWHVMVENFDPEALPNPADDASAFRLWIEAQDDAEAVTSMLATLESHPDFAGKDDRFKEQIRGAAQARVDALEP